VRKSISIIILLINTFSSVYSQKESIDTCSALKNYEGFWYKVNCTDTISLYLKYFRNRDSTGKEIDNVYGWYNYKIRDSIIEDNIPLDKSLLSITSKPSLILKPYYSCNAIASSIIGWCYDFKGAKIDSVILMPSGPNGRSMQHLVYPLKSKQPSIIFKFYGSFIKKFEYDYIILSDGKNNSSNKIDLSLWNEYPLPDYERSNLANNTMTDWSFEKINDSICIKCYDGNSYNSFKERKDSIRNLLKENLFLKEHFREVINVPNGKLVTYGYFESPGGGLWFFSNKAKSYEIKGIYGILKIFNFENRIFCLTGHSSFINNKKSKIYEIRNINNKWIAFPIISGLDSNPNLILVNSDLFVLTSYSVYKITKNMNELKLFDAPFSWSGLYPSSMVKDNEDLYIAMRKGILKVTKFESNPSYKWFIRKSTNEY
jgi:hypothetical protein